MVQHLYKNRLEVSKSHEELGELQTSIGNSKKLKLGGQFLSKK